MNFLIIAIALIIVIELAGRKIKHKEETDTGEVNETIHPAEFPTR